MTANKVQMKLDNLEIANGLAHEFMKLFAIQSSLDQLQYELLFYKMHS